MSEQDSERRGLLTDAAGAKKVAKQYKAARERFYRITAGGGLQQTPCNVMKFMGGDWANLGGGGRDGEKAVCMDHLMGDIKSGSCLVYSFGVSDDWSFEDAMGDLGCRVRAFDPTIDAPPMRTDKISFHKIGIAVADGQIEHEMKLHNVKTLSTLRQEFGETDSKISFLKLDVEGWEIDALQRWADSEEEKGAIFGVRQMQVEFHVDDPYSVRTSTYANLMRAFRTFARRDCFVPVKYAPNALMEKEAEPDSLFFSYFDLHFVKTDKEKCIGNSKNKKQKKSR